MTLKDDRDPQTYAIIGAAMEVHKYLGAGFLEAVYQDALTMELQERLIPFEREVKILIHYKAKPLPHTYKADFICYGEVLVETKAQDRLTGVDESQVINYLVATKLQRALLFNFGASSLQYKRMVHNYHPNPSA
jgi:GxxExxY protein